MKNNYAIKTSSSKDLNIYFDDNSLWELDQKLKGEISFKEWKEAENKI